VAVGESQRDDEAAPPQMSPSMGCKCSLYLRQVDVLDIVRGVVVMDLATGPVDAFDPKHLVLLDSRHRRYVRVPAIVKWCFLLPRQLLRVDGDESFHHGCLVTRAADSSVNLTNEKHTMIASALR